MDEHEHPRTTAAAIRAQIAELQAQLPEADRLGESHPYQFRWLELPVVRQLPLSFIGSPWNVQDEIKEWLDEHAPGHIVEEPRHIYGWIMITDLVSAMAFKMRWL